MKKAVRAIIIKDNNLLVMERDKFGQQYYTLIGGHVELGESLEKALIREVHEETMVRIANPKQVYLEHSEPPYGDQYIYTCDFISGVPMLHPDADERKINKGGVNLYTPIWLPISRLDKVPFRSVKLKNKLIKHLKNGFPDKIQEFSSKIS